MFRDEELRLKLLQIANNNDRGILSLIGDAQALLAFVEGRLDPTEAKCTGLPEEPKVDITWVEGDEPELDVEPLAFEPKPTICPYVTAWSTREVYPTHFYYENTGVRANSIESDVVTCTSHHEPNYSYNIEEPKNELPETVDFVEPEKLTFVQKLDRYLDSDPRYANPRYALDKVAAREMYIAEAVRALYKHKIEEIYYQIDAQLGLESVGDKKYVDPLVKAISDHVYKITPESRGETVDAPIDYYEPPVVEPQSPELTEAIAAFKQRFSGLFPSRRVLSTGNDENDAKMVDNLMTGKDTILNLNELFNPEEKSIVYPEPLQELFDGVKSVVSKAQADNKRFTRSVNDADFITHNSLVNRACMEAVANVFTKFERELRNPKPAPEVELEDAVDGAEEVEGE